MRNAYKAAGVILPLALIAVMGAGAIPVEAESEGFLPASVTAAVSPLVSLSTTSAVAGAQASVSATVKVTGFPARTNGTISFNGTSKSLKTDSTGSASTTITIPTATAGTVNVTAKFGTASASTMFTVTAAPTAVVHSLKFGVTTPSDSAVELDEVTSLSGEAPSTITFYQDWQQPVPVTQLNAITARGASPIIAWEPWVWGAADQSPYALSTIISGSHDAYINQWAQGLKSYGKPVTLRFAHEMNGNWYPWDEGVNGNQPGEYVAAWKHVHDIFSANGATNVNWVWNPNTPYAGSTDLTSLYPGAGYVDTVALDGYNWGTTQTWGSTWQPPSEIFADGLTQLRAIAPGKPIMIAEVASAELGGDKAAWNSQLISYLDSQSDITGFVWFDQNKEVDWRINSSATSSSAFAAALKSRKY